MKRRNLLAGASAGASLMFAAPAVGQQVRHLTLVTDWPDGPGLMASVRSFAEIVRVASRGRIEIEPHPAGARVRPFEAFDAVEAGVADMFHTHAAYYDRKSPALHFFSGLPFGLTSAEIAAWVHVGGGQALYDELCEPFGIKPLLAASPGAQMGGWYRNPVQSVEDLRGLRYRMAGLGAEIYRRLGATVILLPASDIVSALRSGAIDACEWVGPWLDTEMGLHEVAGYYYYPGWHEPGAALTLGIARRVWESLDEADRRLIEAAAAAEFSRSLAEFGLNNARALARLRAAGSVRVERFGQDLLARFAAHSHEVVGELIAADSLSERISESYFAFRDLARDWHGVAEGAFLAAPPVR